MSFSKVLSACSLHPFGHLRALLLRLLSHFLQTSYRNIELMCTIILYLSTKSKSFFEKYIFHLPPSTKKAPTRGALFVARLKGCNCFALALLGDSKALPFGTRLRSFLLKTCHRQLFLTQKPSQASNPSKHKKAPARGALFVARLKGFEPLTFWFVAKHSIQLSYKRKSA